MKKRVESELQPLSAINSVFSRLASGEVPSRVVLDLGAGTGDAAAQLKRRFRRAEVIASVPVPEIEAYRSARYTGAGIVVGAAGNVDHEQIAGLAERLVSPPAGSSANGAAVMPDDQPHRR